MSSDSLGSMLAYLEKVEEGNLKRKSGDGEDGDEGGEKKKQKRDIVSTSC
jgi:hypothetical protein